MEAGVHHVYARGVERRVIFLDDDDRRLYLALLRGVVERFEWHCHVYCLMANHVHLLIQTCVPNLGAGMHMLHGAYARLFNERYARVGHLFQNRFGSRLVQDDLAFEKVAAYILENPVAAGLCLSEDDWPWSGTGLVSRALALPA
jgi:putative transposase